MVLLCGVFFALRWQHFNSAASASEPAKAWKLTALVTVQTLSVSLSPAFAQPLAFLETRSLLIVPNFLLPSQVTDTLPLTHPPTFRILRSSGNCTGVIPQSINPTDVGGMSYKLELSIRWFPSAFPRVFHPPERGWKMQGPPGPVSRLLVGTPGEKGAGKWARCNLSSPFQSWLSVELGFLQIPCYNTSCIRPVGSQGLWSLHLHPSSGKGELLSQNTH